MDKRGLFFAAVKVSIDPLLLGKPVLVDSIFQTFAGLELRLVRCLDSHRFAGAGIAAGRRLALGHGECAKSHQADSATAPINSFLFIYCFPG